MVAVTVRARAAAVAAVLAVAVAFPAAPAPATAHVPARTHEQHIAPAALVAERLAQRVRPGEVLVRFERGVASAQRSLALQRRGAVALNAPGSALQRVAVPVGSEERVAAALAADPAVAHAQPNFVRTAFHHLDPDEVGWSVGATQGVGAPAVWGSATGDGVRVAVIDSGVDGAHRQLLGRVTRGRDIVGGAHGGGIDRCGHGTAVAGVVAAAHDGEQTVGVAPDATIVPVKVLEYDGGACVGDDLSISRGIYWVAGCALDGSSCPKQPRADIINLSLGGPQSSPELTRAVRTALSAGVVVIAAAGNTGDRFPSYPASTPGVISVGGLQRDGATGVRWWPASTFGRVDVAAPGARIRIIRARSATARVGRECGFDDGTLCADGTSFSAPHVAGVIALLFDRHPTNTTWSPATRVRRARQWVLGTTDAVPTSSSRKVGLHTGHGAVDALRAHDLSADRNATLITWVANRRTISPGSRILATPSQARVTTIVTDGRGRPKNVNVQFSTTRSGETTYSSRATDSKGRATTTFSSRAAGTITRLVGAAAGVPLPLEMYVLQRDDNIRGRVPSSTRFRNTLTYEYDSDDVFRFWMRKGERLRVGVSEVNGTGEYVDMWLFRPNARDVTSGAYTPMREDSNRWEFEPLQLRKRVPAKGAYYLDVVGIGSYRLKWSIVWPNRVARLAAAPTTFSPDGDGRAERTRISWRVRTPGRVVLRIRDSKGVARRTVSFGREPEGPESFRWSGRGDGGRVLPSGRYTANVRWSDGKGRVFGASTPIMLER